MKTFRSNIIDAYDRFTRRERQIANLLLDTPQLLLLNSASELAEKAQVSNSTVTRFVKGLNFDNYDAMRRAVRRDSTDGSPLSLVRSQTSEDAPDLASLFATEEIAVINSTFSNLDMDQLEDAATAMVHAPQLGFLGMRNSHFFASYAHWQFVQFRRGTRLIAGAGETNAEHLAGFKSGDVVVVIGVRRIVKQLRACIDILADAGVDILLVADASSLHLARNARWTIVCPVENEHVFDSYSGVLAVLRLLAYTTLQKAGAEGIAYMETIEDFHERLEEM